MTMPVGPDNISNTVDALAARRFFNRSARHGPPLDVLAREVERRMAERLDYIRLEPRRILDAGAGGGHGMSSLHRRYPKALLVAIDSAHSVLKQAPIRSSFALRARNFLGGNTQQLVCGDFSRLPFPAQTFQLLWSNLALAWAVNPLAVFKDFGRVLDVGGLVMFSTYGPDTLSELREAFASVDSMPHALPFVDMHDVGDMLVAAGFCDPVMDMEVITLTYAHFDALLADLRLSGQLNAAGGRRRSLSGPRKFLAVQSAYESLRKEGQLPMTIEVVYGHAWRAEPRVDSVGRDIIRMEFNRARTRT